MSAGNANTAPLIIIGARLNSSRLPRKHLQLLAGKPLIERISDRLQQSALNPRIVLATTADDCNRDLVAWAEQANVECYAYQGDVNDLVGRIDAIVATSKAEQIVYICGDCPFVSPAFIDAAMTALQQDPEADSIRVRAPAACTRVVHEGIAVYSRNGWHTLARLSTTASQREHVGSIDHSVFKLAAVDEQAALFDRTLRLSIDTPADLRFCQAIYQHWYQLNPADSLVDLEWVLTTTAANAEFLALNRHVIQKKADQYYPKVVVICEASSSKGIGQLRRSRKIAINLMEQKGFGIELWLHSENITGGPLLNDINHRLFDNEVNLIAAIGPSDADIIVVDIIPQRQHHLSDWQAALAEKKRQGGTLIGIDHCVYISDVFDQVIVPSPLKPSPLTASQQQNPQRAHSATPILWGWPYVMACDHQLIDNTSRHGNTIIILTGGSDACGYGQWLALALDQVLAGGVSIDWVQGPLATPPQLPPASKNHWRLVYAPENIEALMSTATVAISVYGTTIGELLSLQIPTVVLPAPGVIADAEYQQIITSDLFVGLNNVANELDRVASLLANRTQQQVLVERMQKSRLQPGSPAIADAISDAYTMQSR